MRAADPGSVRGASGYMHRRYAQSHAAFGSPRELPSCGGWILERAIPAFPDRDAMGCYPLFACRDWSRLHVDIDALAGELVSLAVVTDPFGEYDEAYLRRCFPDLVVPFKEHFVIDLEKPHNRVVSKHHRYEARKALRKVTVHRHPNPPEFLAEWMALHRHLTEKHDVRGVAAFSRDAFAEQLSTPGIVVLYATLGDQPVAAMLYYLQGAVAHAHLLGCSPIGYEHGALYALLWRAIETFTGTARWLNLMGVPGRSDAGSEGIRQFKRGWTREHRTAWLCGRILDPARYAAIVAATQRSAATYFPGYRSGEMA